ncbi:transient receptor potential cation channel subfamily M member 2-like isoform X2 [Lissotriton helveticus]
MVSRNCHVVHSDGPPELWRSSWNHLPPPTRRANSIWWKLLLNRDSVADDAETTWIKTKLKKKECVYFFANPDHRSEVCYCGNVKAQHLAEVPVYTEGQPKWNLEKHIKERPTDACGDLTFKDLGNKRAKYVRASNDTSPEVLFQMMTDQWQLRVPNLLITVTGGAKSFNMNHRLKNLFSKGLVKAAQTTGAWIITGGCHAGVMQLVGEAVRDFSMTDSSYGDSEIVTIGIATWGIVYNRASLISKADGRPAEYDLDEKNQGGLCCLDNNHSHFILVDDGTQGRYGVEIPLRTKLERFISEQAVKKEGEDMKIPIVCVVLEGGPGTLDTIHNSMINNTPCVIVEGSGRVADVIAQVADMNPSKITVALITEKLHSLFTDTFNEKQIIAWTKKIQDIVRMSQLLTIFREDKGGAQEVDVAILQALLKASQSMDYKGHENWAYQLKLAVVWNRLDIAKSGIFNSEWSWKPEDLYPALTLALTENKPQFVQLFLDQGVCLQDYVTEKTLLQLYNEIDPTSLFYQKIKNAILSQDGLKLGDVARALQNLLGKSTTPLYPKTEPQSVNITTQPTREPQSAVNITTQDIEGDTPAYHTPQERPEYPGLHEETELQDLEKRPLVPDEKGGTSGGTSAYGSFEEITERSGRSVEIPLRSLEQRRSDQLHYSNLDLLIWAVVQNRGELAEILWTKSPDCVVGALACIKILKSVCMEEKDTDNVEAMKALVDQFEEWASGVFSECCRSNQLLAEQLLTRTSLAWGRTTCLQLAIKAEARSFMSHGGVQMLLTKIWWGKLSVDNTSIQLLICMVFPPLICTNFLNFREDTKIGKDLTTDSSQLVTLKRRDSAAVKRLKKSDTLTSVQRLRGFFNAPVVVFFGNVVSYITFLWLFAYVLMVDFQATPSWAEYLLYIWIFSFLCEEVRQLFFDHDNVGFVIKARMYILESWNQMDVVAISLFTAGVVCRCITVSLYAGRVILALDFIIFCVRLMHIFTVSRVLGPKIMMMQKMIKDFFFFLFLMAVWMGSFGVSKQAILVQNEERLDWIFRSVIYEPYLILFGQLPTDVDKLNFDNSTCTADGSVASQPKCAQTVDGVPVFPEWLAMILLCLYLLLANILLLNLLIAMFSHTFSEVQDNTDQIWKFQRHNLIKEYSNRPPTPPPFILLNLLYFLVRYVILKKEFRVEKHFRYKLGDADNKVLLFWEKEMKKNYLLSQRDEQNRSSDRTIRDTSYKVDAVVKLLEFEHESRARAMEQRMVLLEEQMFQSTVALNWIMKSLTEKGFASEEKAPVMVNLKCIEAEEPTSEDKPMYSTCEYHVNSRQLMYPASNVERFPVPDELVPWQVDFPHYDPPSYMAEKEGRETHNPWIESTGSQPKREYPLKEDPPLNPEGRTGIRGLGSLMWYGPNHCLHPMLTRWKKNKNGCFTLKGSKKVLEVLAVKREGSERWGLPGGRLRPDEKMPSTLKAILKKEFWQTFEALLEKGTESLPDLKSTNSIRWQIVDQKIPLFANMKDIMQKLARKLDSHY